MLTDRGRFALAVGGAVYLAGWAFGSRALYPVAIGLVLAVLAAVAWVRLTARPVRLRRTVSGGEHTAGDDVPVELKLDVEGRFVPRSLSLEERIDGLGTQAVQLRKRGDRLVGRYVLGAVPRGRYPIEDAGIAVEDPFALERRELDLAAPGALLVYPKLVALDALFSETGSRMQDGRRLLMRRPSGFDLHSVREYEQGESLRRVHWPSTAKRGMLMVKGSRISRTRRATKRSSCSTPTRRSTWGRRRTPRSSSPSPPRVRSSGRTSAADAAPA
jgi:uncharacterized protein (DUF58 family)